ncbi:MAG TPA: energy-coupling factor transporter transmembrane component T [Actinomycetota bacterium]|nr:energy-coupling factor transporter transmembrane component T [Actinomycetota bacterium]
MHPGAWLVWTMCASLIAISTTNPFYLLPLFAVSLLIYATQRRPGAGASTFKAFVLFGLIAIATRTFLVVFGPVSREALAAAGLEGLRLAVLLSVYGALNSVTDPYRFLRLAPRRFHEPALAGALALSIAPRTVEAVGHVREAQRLRGIHIGRWRTLPALAVPVLETGMEQAVTLAESMDSRGHGRGERSRYRPQPWGPSSWIIVCAALAALAFFAVSMINNDGGLSVSTYPLTWPEADPLLVGGVMLLAVPALLPREVQS